MFPYDPYEDVACLDYDPDTGECMFDGGLCPYRGDADECPVSE